jgi:hypothetical protein
MADERVEHLAADWAEHWVVHWVEHLAEQMDEQRAVYLAAKRVDLRVAK